MKRIDEPCTVKTREDEPAPYLFKWRNRTWEVRSLQEVWRKQSKWWTEDGPERRTYYRCTVHRGKASRGGHTVVELCLKEKGFREDGGRKKWYVARLSD